MTFQKRGLGRGLEVLLTDSPALEGLQQNAVITSDKTVDRTVISKILIESILEEAEALKSLLDEVESIIRTEQQ
ncbi:MAG: hypothetical protein PHG00_05185 [Methylococcales bacterium]|nr:hypothetical protein [Methylococcales bacterium]